jgi:hypothetical protein
MFPDRHLANRLEAFFNAVDFEPKVECLIAMLEMGTSHNRWYVERKFVSFCGPAMELNLAKRLAVQFRISDEDSLDLMWLLQPPS